MKGGGGEEEGKYIAMKFWIFYVVGLVVVLVLYKACSSSPANNQTPQKPLPGQSKRRTRHHHSLKDPDKTKTT